MPRVIFNQNTLNLNNLTKPNAKTMILKDLDGKDKQIQTGAATMDVTGTNEYIMVTTTDGEAPYMYKYANSMDKEFGVYGTLKVVWDGDLITIRNEGGEITATYGKA